MSLVKVRKSNQVTIPKKLSRELGIQEGDYVAFNREGNRLYIEPALRAKKDLASLWREKAKEMETVKLSKEGEQMVAEAIAELERGEGVGPFDTIEDALKCLKTAQV